MRRPPESREQGPDHVAERRVAELGEPFRVPGRLRPVLAELVELVRRGADGDARGRARRAAPRSRRPRGARRPRGRGRRRLTSRRPWPPAARGRAAGPAATAASSGRSTRSSCSAANSATAAGLGGLQGRRPVLAGQCRAPRRCAHQVANRSRPGPSRDSPRRSNSGPGAAASKSSASAARLDSQTVSRSRPSSALSSRAATPIRSIWARSGSAQRGVLVGVLDPEVRRVGEAPRRREVRRRLDRRDRLGRVQRVDQHEVGALAGGPARQRAPGRRGRRGPTNRPSAPGTAASSRPRPGRARAPPAAAARAGETSRVAVARGPSSGSACSRCQPGGRSPGSSTVARPTRRPSTSRGATQWSTCRTSRVLPSSSSISTSTDAPSVTCTGTHGRPPDPGDDRRRQHPAPVAQLGVLVGRGAPAPAWPPRPRGRRAPRPASRP